MLSSGSLYETPKGDSKDSENLSQHSKTAEKVKYEDGV